MAIKSLISSARQIRSSELYKDKQYVDGSDIREVPAAYQDNGSVAEGTTYLQEDLNYMRAQLNAIIGKTSWFSSPSISLESLASTGNKTIIQPVQLANIAFTAGSADTGITSGVAASESASTLGYVFGPAATDGKHRVILRDALTNMPIVSPDEKMVFGLIETSLSDGATISTGSDLQIKTYVDVNGTVTAYSYTGTAEVIIPQRVNLADASENFTMVNAGFANAVGSIELGDRRWIALDSTDGTFKIIDGNNSELVINTNDDLTKVINSLIKESLTNGYLSDGFKSFLGLTFNEGTDWTVSTDLDVEWDGDGVNTNYINYDAGAGTTTILGALKVLDNQLKVVEDLANSASADVEVTILAATLAEGSPLTVPNSKTILIDDKDACNVYVNGQLLSSDKQVSGTAGDGSGDYNVASSTSIVFSFPLIVGDVVSIHIFKSGN